MTAYIHIQLLTYTHDNTHCIVKFKSWSTLMRTEISV